VGVDTQRLAEEHEDVRSIPGGSIFCRCLVTEFIGMLNRLVEEHGRQPLEGVVIEASGMANPRVVGDMLRETRLDQAFNLHTVLSIVDPGSFLKLLHTLPNIRAQVETADVVLVNKVDLYSDGDIARAEDAVREIHPSVRVLRTEKCVADIDLFDGASQATDLHGELAPCRDPHFCSMTVALPGLATLAQLEAVIREHAALLYRAKGVVEAGGRAWDIDFTASGWTAEPYERDGATRGLVLVARGEQEAALRDLAQRLQGR
jgi:G3E family GTPase